MIEDHYDYTGYAYVYNNPINLIDPFGMDSIKVVHLNDDGSVEKMYYYHYNNKKEDETKQSKDSENEDDEYHQNGGIPTYGQGSNVPREKAKHTEQPIDMSPFFPSGRFLKKQGGAGNIFDLVQMIQDWFTSDGDSKPTANKLSKTSSSSSGDNDSDEKARANEVLGDSIVSQRMKPGSGMRIDSYEIKHKTTNKGRKISGKEYQYKQKLQKIR